MMVGVVVSVDVVVPKQSAVTLYPRNISIGKSPHSKQPSAGAIRLEILADPNHHVIKAEDLPPLNNGVPVLFTKVKSLILGPVYE